MTTPTLHPMDELPQSRTDRWHEDDSVNVVLHYSNGDKCNGYHSGWSGWMRYGTDGMLWACDDDRDQPVGWSELEAK